MYQASRLPFLERVFCCRQQCDFLAVAPPFNRGSRPFNLAWLGDLPGCQRHPAKKRC